jgi:magnesium-transporting ATPase (P-type)
LSAIPSPWTRSVIAADPNALEAKNKNINFNGSLVVGGGCLAVAIRPGDATLIGTMATSARAPAR